MVLLCFPDTGIWSLGPFGPLIWLIRWVGLLHGADSIRVFCVCFFLYPELISLLSICNIMLSSFLLLLLRTSNFLSRHLWTAYFKDCMYSFCRLYFFLFVRLFGHILTRVVTPIRCWYIFFWTYKSVSNWRGFVIQNRSHLGKLLSQMDWQRQVQMCTHA